MSCRNRLLGSFLTLTAGVLLAGCGGGGDSQVAQNTAPAATPSPPTQSSAPEEPYSEGYGAEGSSGGGYGSDSGGGDGMSSDGYGSEDETNSGGYGSGGMGQSGGRRSLGGDSGGMMSGYEDMPTMGENLGYGDGYDPNAGDMAGMSGPGMGMAMGDGYGGGYGGGMPNSNINQMTQFIGQNCVNCHGPRQTKGDIRLDGLTGNFSDKANAELWKKVMQQLETGAMPPSNAPSRPNPSQSQALVSFVKQALDANGMLEDEDFLSQAKYAFGIGKEKEAIDLLYAHAITAEEEEAKNIFLQSRWFALGPKPATTLRFAVGAILQAPSTLTDIKPIGASQLAGSGGGGGGSYGDEGGSFGRPGGAAGSNAERERSFRSLSGGFGVGLVSAFESRWSAGKLGGVFNDVVSIEPRQPQLGNQGGFGGPGGGRSMGGMGGMISGGMGGIDDGYSSDDGYGGSYGGGGFGGQAGAPGKAKEIMPGKIITPGLIYLGTGSQAELLEKARVQGIDGLFVFDIDASQNRMNGMINNDTRLRLMQVDGKALAATKTLKNTEIERAKLRGIDGDEVQKNIDRLFVSFDEKFELAPMPALKPEHAKNRLRQLLAAREALPEEEEASMNLAVLFEARMFQSQGLVSQEDMATVYQIVLEGNEGETLAVGTADDRKLVLEEIVPTI